MAKSPRKSSLGVTYRIVCLEFSKRCLRFDKGSELYFIPEDDDLTSVLLDGIGVYDLEDGAKVSAIVYEMYFYNTDDSKEFNHTAKFRHDFKENVHIDSEEYPACIRCEGGDLIKFYDAPDIVQEVKGIEGELSQFVA